MRASSLLVILLGAVAWGCGSECTEKGCLNTVTIAFTDTLGMPLMGVRGSVTLGAEMVEFDCAAAPVGEGTSYRCVENAVVIYAAEAPQAVLNVSTADGVLTLGGTLNLEFTTVYPNGPGCPGECTSSTENVVRLSLMGG